MKKGATFTRNAEKVTSGPQSGPAFDPATFLNTSGPGRDLREYHSRERVFSQGAPATNVFYIRKGKIKLSVVSRQGKEAVISLLGSGDFFGEPCVAGKALRTASATTMAECSLLQIEKDVMVRALQDEPAFSQLFLSYLLTRSMRIEEDLVDHLFNSSEKRLARILLLMADFGNEGKSERVIAKISQETLAEMVGTTRSRVSYFMNKFRRLGFIKYNGRLEVRRSLLSVVLHD